MQFKQRFDTPKYVNLNMSKYQINLTARLQLGILPIAIETGQFTSTPLNERNCFTVLMKLKMSFILFVNVNCIHTIVKNCLKQNF